MRKTAYWKSVSSVFILEVALLQNEGQEMHIIARILDQ